MAIGDSNFLGSRRMIYCAPPYLGSFNHTCIHYCLEDLTKPFMLSLFAGRIIAEEPIVVERALLVCYMLTDLAPTIHRRPMNR